jgi:hypothetical protein
MQACLQRRDAEGGVLIMWGGDEYGIHRARLNELRGVLEIS